MRVYTISVVREKYLRSLYNIFRVPKLPNNTNEYALAAICLLFKSKAGLGSKPKSLRLFAVCAALAAEFLVLLSRFIKVGALPLSDVREKYLKGFYNIFRVPKLPNNTNEYALCGDLLTF